MRLMIGLVAIGLNFAATAIAQTAAVPLTYSASKKAFILELAGGGSIAIDRINAGRDDSIASVSIIYNSRIVEVPGATISPGSNLKRLKTSLSEKDLRMM